MTTTINVRVLLLLHIVETMVIGLPDFDVCIGNWLALGRQYASMQETWLTRGSIGDVVSVRERGVSPPRKRDQRR